MGNISEVAGNTSTDGDQIIGKGNMYEQATFMFHKIDKLLQQVGASLQHVVRTRMYVTDISLWEEAGQSPRLFFKNIKPAATMVQVNKLINDNLLIEIEVTAMVNE